MSEEDSDTRVGSIPARVVFFGAGAFGRPMLEALVGLAGVEVVGVVSAPDRPTGRGGRLTPTPVTDVARGRGLQVLRPARLREPATVAAIEALRPDLGVLADYGRIVPQSILDLPPAGILNVHPSLLPRHRGATPIGATIMAGDDHAGVTIIRMDAGLDTGPIVASTSWPLVGTETAPELELEAGRVGARLLVDTIPDWLRGERAAVPQDEAAATMTRPFRREDGRLDPMRSVVELERQVRALEPWPGTFVETAAGRLAVLAASAGEGRPDDVPGAVVEDGPGLALACLDGRLRLTRVQLAGGRAMPIAEFRRGAGRRLAGSRVTNQTNA